MNLGKDLELLCADDLLEPAKDANCVVRELQYQVNSVLFLSSNNPGDYYFLQPQPNTSG